MNAVTLEQVIAYDQTWKHTGSSGHRTAHWGIGEPGHEFTNGFTRKFTRKFTKTELQALGYGCDGLVVNLIQWDFSKLLGVYVAVFAVVSVLFGKWGFRETNPSSTWVGLLLIAIGGAFIQYEDKIPCLKASGK